MKSLSRRSVLPLAASILVLGILLPSAKGEAHTVTDLLSTESTNGCAEVAPTISESTVEVPEAQGYSGTSVQAQVIQYGGSATGTEEVLPPANWRPAAATPAELEFFGVPPRPTDGAQLTSWTDEWVTHYTGFGVLGVCSPTIGASAGGSFFDSAGSGTTDNWSGVVAYPGNVTEAYAQETVIPGSPCSTQPDSYASWVGIGGYNNPYLIQNGWWNAHTQGSYPFFEAINGNLGLDTYVTPVSFSWSEGDFISESTTYNISTGTAVFSWHDATSGIVYSLYANEFDISGTEYSATNFYYGPDATGDVIDERGTIGGEYTTLRDYVSNAWTSAEVSINGGSLEAIRSPVHDGVTMSEGGTEYSYPDGTGLPATAFTDYWVSCGGEG